MRLMFIMDNWIVLLEELGSPGASESMKCIGKNVWHNSLRVKGLLQCAEMLSMSAGEERDARFTAK